MMDNYEIDETAWKKNFSDTLLRLMGKRNISINKLAAEILVDPKSIRNYIDKKSVPSAIILKKLADYFEVSTDSLIQSQDRFSGQTIAALAVQSPCNSTTTCLLPFSKNCIFPEGKRTMLKS